MPRINVTKTFLPPIEGYKAYIDKIWESDQLTNQGPLLRDFEAQLKEYLQVDDFQFVTNGTLALQVAIEALQINSGEIITTPFSYVATTSSILWQHAAPVFVDIDPETLCIDAQKIEAAITPDTKAILAVHVFGNPCDVEEIERIASKHDLKVIYDGAHAFDVNYKGKSLFSYGDISICSFHATKLFHTIEGGGIFTSDAALSERVDLVKRFGHNGDDHFMLGLNAKASEFQAAMGLTNLPYVPEITKSRKAVSDWYDEYLDDTVRTITFSQDATRNYSYYPLIFKDEAALNVALENLAAADIYPRRYFYPSLNKLPYLEETRACVISEDIATRIVCLPLYVGLDEEMVKNIAGIINGK